MLGHPALVARHRRGDPQREALLAEQGVAAVAGAEGPDLPRLGVVDDVLVVLVAGPGDVLDALGQRHPDRVHAGDELAVGAELVEGGLAHPGHDPHRDRDVGGVGQLDADFGDRRSRAGPSRRAPRTSSGPSSQPLKRPFSVSRISAGARQLLVGPASASSLGADEGAVLDPGHVGGVGEGEVGVRALGVGEPLEGAGVDQGLREGVVLLGGAVAPVDGVGLGQVAISPTQSRSFGVGGQARGPSVRSLIRLSLFVRFEADEADVGFLVADLQSRGCLLAVGERSPCK